MRAEVRLRVQHVCCGAEECATHWAVEYSCRIRHTVLRDFVLGY